MPTARSPTSHFSVSALADMTKLEAIEFGHGQKARPRKGTTERDSFTYDGETFARAGPAHRALMQEACRAKFAQNLEAREALLATGDRPLTHRPRRDSTTIPGALIADIWMRVRAALPVGAGG